MRDLPPNIFAAVMATGVVALACRGAGRGYAWQWAAVALFDKLVVHLDEPFADVSMFPTYMVSSLAREHVAVALSGDGGTGSV